MSEEDNTMEQSYNTTTASNYGYAMSSALQIRLDTNPILENIELFLRGKKIVLYQDDNGNIQSKHMSIGGSKANPLGIQSILNYVTSVFNSQVVQGNFTNEMFQDYIEELHIDFATIIVNNMYNWEIDENDIDVIIDFFTKLVIPFMSRLIGNKERDSYQNTIRTIESSRLETGGGKNANVFNNKG